MSRLFNKTYQLSLAASLVFTLAACGGGGDSDGGSPTPSSGPEQAQTSNTGSTTGTSSVTGTWVRLPGPSGDRTDVAIGVIKNEPTNRVYMCEKKGSTAAGLYKGTITNNVVKWDAQYGLPDAEFTLSSGRLVVQYKVSGSLATPYDKGAWSGECGPLENVPPTKVAVVLPAGLTGIVGITIDGKSVPYTSLAAGATAPDCTNPRNTYTLPAPANRNSTGEYYKVVVTHRGQGADTITRTTPYETAFYEWYFKAGACNPYVVDFGPQGYTLIDL